MLLKDWLIQIESEEEIFIGSIDEDGNYNILVGEGDYIVSLFFCNDVWDVCLFLMFLVSFIVIYDMLIYNFLVWIVVDVCFYLVVVIILEFLIECM